MPNDDRDRNIIVRKLRGGDWRELKLVRLLALRNEPGKYFRSYADEADLPDSEWTALAEGTPERQVFGMFDGTVLVGISAAYLSMNARDERVAHFGMTYILERYRGRGLVDRFYDARIAWARAHCGIAVVETGHRRSNEPSKRAMERHGFRYVAERPHRWPDGTEETYLRYELRLRDATMTD